MTLAFVVVHHVARRGERRSGPHTVCGSPGSRHQHHCGPRDEPRNQSHTVHDTSFPEMRFLNRDSLLWSERMGAIGSARFRRSLRQRSTSASGVSHGRVLQRATAGQLPSHLNEVLLISGRVPTAVGGDMDMVVVIRRF